MDLHVRTGSAVHSPRVPETFGDEVDSSTGGTGAPGVVRGARGRRTEPAAARSVWSRVRRLVRLKWSTLVVVLLGCAAFGLLGWQLLHFPYVERGAAVSPERLVRGRARFVTHVRAAAVAVFVRRRYSKLGPTLVKWAASSQVPAHRPGLGTSGRGGGHAGAEVTCVLLRRASCVVHACPAAPHPATRAPYAGMIQCATRWCDQRWSSKGLLWALQ